MISLTSPVRTRAHGWPAGAKLAALCVATVALFAWSSLWVQGAVALLVLCIYAAPGPVFLRYGLRRLWPLWPFVVILLGYHLWIGSPETGAVIALRMVSAVALANLVTMTTGLTQMMGVVSWMLAPTRRLGIGTRAIELAVALVVRFTPVLADKGRGLTQAWQARAARRPGWRIVVPFLVLALDDADHVADALRARGGL
ncbi:energy-coupling factor transporter transmembrane protein EcfT [Sulfitobacter sp. S190]|uniref:energy-coupling factor transporter transmembrane component T family protein n=1 Tax=Sulfitobacter sp. S190 TaxID=2867022 RepID=UPI0021A300DC|nr:energy-coupling factor transporter transmembrane component T [Sulfitobacter sp. S190]UWR22815.1 energy-coupling factor transporter transmembrane protein EcfT [Sulfitobacter sp. S190]